MQKNILEPYPQANIQVYAIWFNVLAADHRTAWDPTLLPDARVKHYWDQELLASRWFSNNGYFDYGSVAWDVYYLFAPKGEWGEQEIGPLISSGYTIIARSNDLFESIKPMLTN